MKRRIIAAMLSMALFCTALPVRAQADNETRIYEFLTKTMKLNTAAACGILGNLHVETGGSFSPTTLNPNDSGGTQSYGICQWNSGAGRYDKLKSWCASNGYDYKSLDGQLRFMQYELESTPYYKLSSLRAVPNTKDGAYEACRLFEVYYEGCSSASYSRRENLAMNTYWPKYKNYQAVTVHPSACGGDKARCPSASYTDVPAYGNWAHGGIDYVLSNGLFNGTGKNRFSPNASMTRAMLVTVLWRGCAEPTGYENTFSDVKAGAWYAEAVAWGQASGVVNGIEDGRFAPDDTVTREQIATILFRMAKLGGADTGTRAQLSSFPDQGKVSGWAKEAMQWAVATKLIEGVNSGGKNYLQPRAGATRAQVATIIMRFSEWLEKTNSVK